LQGDDTSSTPILRELTSFRGGIVNSSGQLETFDSGSILLTIDQKEAQRKMEVIVERDDLAGVDDEIELSVHSYVNGKPQPLPVRPRIVLSMEQEKEVWKLNEVTVAMHVPLSDPDFLKDLQKTQNPGSESSAVASLRTIMTAEIAYSSAFPERGFTCNLSELGGSELQDKPTHEHAMLIDDALASGKRGGYIFSISGCDVAPASKFSVTAAPKEPDSELRAFCSDESAVLRYAADGKAATCLSEGVPLE
jgi:type IV pilus assembly protein PilA